MADNQRLFLSKKTQTTLAGLSVEESVDNLLSVNKEVVSLEQPIDSAVNLSDYITFMSANIKVKNDEERLNLEKFRAYLLIDIEQWLTGIIVDDEETRQKQEAIATKIAILSFIGGISAFLNGLVDAYAVVMLIPGVSLWVVGAYCAFAGLIGILVFYAFDRTQIATNLKRKRIDITNELEAIDEQSQHLDKVINGILCKLAYEPDSKDSFNDLIAELEKRYQAIEEKLQEYKNGSHYELLTLIAAWGTATFYFSTGYFMAHPAIMLASKFMFTSFLSSLTVTSMPVIAFGVVLGICGLIIYKYCEKPQLEKFIRARLGVDDSVIDSCSKSIQKSKTKLSFNSAKDKALLSNLDMSEVTQSYYEKIKEVANTISSEVDNSSLEYALNLLKITVVDKDQQIQFEIFRAYLLKDLYHHLSASSGDLKEIQKNQQEIASKINKLTIIGSLLAFINAAVDGESVLELIPNLATWVSAVYCIMAGMIGVLVFYAFDKTQIASNLGQERQDVADLVESYAEQSKQIHALLVEMLCIKASQGDTADKNKELAMTLVDRYGKIETGIDEVKNGTYHEWVVNVASIGTAAFYFSAGYFMAAPTLTFLSHFVFTSLLSTLTATSLPVVAFGLALGLCGLIIYAYCESPPLAKFVSQCLGYDQDSIDACAVNLKESKPLLETLKKTYELSIFKDEQKTKKDLTPNTPNSLPENPNTAVALV